MTIFILIMIIIIIAASFAFAPSAPQKPTPQQPSGEIRLPDGYIVIAPPPKKTAPPKSPENWTYVMWNIIMGIVFILVLLSLLLVR